MYYNRIPKRMKSKRFWTRWQTFVFIYPAVFLLLAGLTVFLVLIFKTPSAELVNRKISQSTIIYDRTGEHVLYQIYGEENRQIVSHEEIPNTVRMATLAAEDDNFYHHFGVDFNGIARAIMVNWQKGGTSQGGSTITQQLAKNVFLTPERSWKRKLSEITLAFKIEFKYTKDQILDFYLNQVPYGSNAYGIQSAAKVYFSKDAKDLTLDEAAMLAALTKATSYYSPYGTHRSELVDRQKYIIKRAGEIGKLDESTINEYLSKDTLANLKPNRESITAPHFVFYIIDELEKKLGKDVLESGGFKVYTSLDYDMQKKAEELVLQKALYNQTHYKSENAALVALDPKTGEVLAMVGSRDYFDPVVDGNFNVATNPRQPGSSFKPIVYARAFEKGFQPETMLYDLPTNFGPDGSGKDYTPKNYNGRFNGLVSMRQALGMSLNVPAVKTLYLAGLDGTMELAQRLGISTLKRRNQYGLSLALGGGEMTLLEETGAFSVFANDGTRSPVKPIKKIEKANGELVFNGDDVQPQRVIDSEVARKINSILSDNKARSAVFGPASPLFIKDYSVAAKTGTTQEDRDGWTVGYSPSIAVGVWAGNNDYRPMIAGADGVYVAAPLWSEYMKWALTRFPNEGFQSYQKVTSKKPMVTGNLKGDVKYFDAESGKKLNEKKRKKTDENKIIKTLVPDEPHSLLYFVNKNDPLGETKPDFNDPMFKRWEQSIQDFFDKNKDKNKDKNN